MTSKARAAVHGRRKAVWGVSLAFLTLAAGVSAQSQGPIRLSPLNAQPIRVQPMTIGQGAFSGLRRDSRTATIHGIVMNHLGELVPHAGVVIVRRLADGEEVGKTSVDGGAQFLFRNFDPGVYAAELVDGSGGVIATSGAFTAGVGEIIQLAPVIPAGQLSGLAALAASATDGTLKAATSAGITAVAAGTPASP